MITIQELKPVFTAEQIQKRVKELGEQITRDYEGQDFICVGVLSGAVIFFSDLLKNIDSTRVSLDFMRVSSYGSATETSGVVKIIEDVKFNMAGKNVLIIEDLIDSGLTMKKVKEVFIERGAKSVKLCALINKKERREVDVTIDYYGFELDKGFILGYGMDFDGRYRNLPAVYEAVIKEE
ncbi:hypoxanthine phosphoribosyltransferase [Succinivibrio dextrinosolvens DSM 3072]|uniref:Hypoxanthine phosphoribosyltransferase n=1 Tax=Succinivibrio dextrinosolvens DSM 3072 TaxID=1123324 RepID=A0A1T4UV97_9GAMM|nr:hypoxanthine phosphoribosyltransferase [Succinivibrio dextrinosolvens]SKA56594.1 hypoxanthine phosphoribosyltransferase [Succinivibrio dextrinosolvens DSM 3072]